MKPARKKRGVGRQLAALNAITGLLDGATPEQIAAFEEGAKRHRCPKRGPRRGWWCRTHKVWSPTDQRNCCRWALVQVLVKRVSACDLRPLYEGEA